MATKYPAQRIDVTFDQYLQQSVNLTEHQLRDLFDVIQKFTCQMYNVQKSSNVHDGRFQLFINSYKATSVNENFNRKMRNIDASSKPPCKSKLFQQFLRAHYISSIWKRPHFIKPVGT
ncbi:hypothetical protein M0804_013779 [Polistes exclamans]|nr:hypothetical protein M0804_013779 [Polistes exclamans]